MSSATSLRRPSMSTSAEMPSRSIWAAMASRFAPSPTTRKRVSGCFARTVAAASTNEKEEKPAKTWNVDAAKSVGKKIAERALAKGVKQVVFDRGGYIYHGRVKALAEAAREGGLEF